MCGVFCWFWQEFKVYINFYRFIYHGEIFMTDQPDHVLSLETEPVKKVISDSARRREFVEDGKIWETLTTPEDIDAHIAKKREEFLRNGIEGPRSPVYKVYTEKTAEKSSSRRPPLWAVAGVGVLILGGLWYVST
jgi:hypothetical protein